MLDDRPQGAVCTRVSTRLMEEMVNQSAGWEMGRVFERGKEVDDGRYCSGITTGVLGEWGRGKGLWDSVENGLSENEKNGVET